MNNAVTREQQRQEAIERLRILEERGLMPEVRRDFEKGRINYSDRLSFSGLGANGILYWLEGNPELEKVVRDFEESTGSLAYHATHETFEFGEVLDIFCVSKYEEEWPMDREDLKDGYSLVFAANLTSDWLSEYGTISFEARGGGLVRNA